MALATKAMAYRKTCEQLVYQLDVIRTEFEEERASSTHEPTLSALREIFGSIDQARVEIVNLHDSLAAVIPTERLR